MSQTKMQEVSVNEKEGRDRPNPEVVYKGERRQFSQAYKQRIVEEAERCAAGEVGSLLRREGLYGSHLNKWRRELAGKSVERRRRNQGRQEPFAVAEALTERLQVVESENAVLRSQLVQAPWMPTTSPASPSTRRIRWMMRVASGCITCNATPIA